MVNESHIRSIAPQLGKRKIASISLPSDSLPAPIRGLFALMVGQGRLYGSASIESSTLLGVCSSHSKRLGFADRCWQQAAVQAIRHAKSSRRRLLLVGDTPYSIFLQHLCLRLQAPLSVIHVVRSDKEPDLRLPPACDAWKQEHIFCLENEDDVEPSLRCLPLHDRLLIALSDAVFALHVKPGGKIEKLLRARLMHKEIPSSSLKVAWTSREDSRWIQNGAVGWFGPWSLPIASNTQQLLEDANGGSLMQCHTAPPATQQPRFASSSMLRGTGDKFLIHCTRGRQGPWPDQSWEQFCDELLLDQQRYESTPFETLVRILVTGRLIATSDRKPGGVASVSFSQRDLQGLLQERRFQRHLGRWDWEPYGLMLSRVWLEQIGARPVRYLKKSQSKGTPLGDVAEVQWIDDTGQGQDWSKEREWRLFTDLRLSRCHSAPGFVFVPTEREASALQHISPWPIMVVDLVQATSNRPNPAW